MEIISIRYKIVFLLMDPISITEAIKNSVEKLGIEHLKNKQREAITALMEGKDVFVSLPTGLWKSLIYALLPYAFNTIISLDCLQARPCNFFLSSWPAPTINHPCTYSK